MNNLSITSILEGTPLTISATSMPSLDGMGTGAIRSSVFEINNSSSNVNFISHVWSCCSDLYFAVKACGPKGRQGIIRLIINIRLNIYNSIRRIVKLLYSSWNIALTAQQKILFFKFHSLNNLTYSISMFYKGLDPCITRPNRFQRLKPIIRMKWDSREFPF